jgi:hypothetical protein
MAERKVIDGQASANVPGALGHALAAVIITTARAIGEQLQKQAMSRKDRLAELLKLDKPSIVEFIADMRATQEQIGKDAKAVPNRSLTDYLTDNPSENSVYSETSMWLGLARSVDAGWKPMNDKGEPYANVSQWPEWRLIAMSAAKARDSIGKPSADGKNPNRAGSGTKKQGKGRPVVAPQQKAINAVANAMKDDKGQPLPKNNRNLAQVIEGILVDATPQELVEVAAVVQKMMARADKAEKDAAEATAKAAKQAKDGKPVEQQPEGSGTQTTKAGATVKHTRTSDKPGQQQKEGTVNEEPVADNLIRRSRAISRAS